MRSISFQLMSRFPSDRGGIERPDRSAAIRNIGISPFVGVIFVGV